MCKAKQRGLDNQPRTGTMAPLDQWPTPHSICSDTVITTFQLTHIMRRETRPAPAQPPTETQAAPPRVLTTWYTCEWQTTRTKHCQGHRVSWCDRGGRGEGGGRHYNDNDHMQASTYASTCRSHAHKPAHGDDGASVPWSTGGANAGSRAKCSKQRAAAIAGSLHLNPPPPPAAAKSHRAPQIQRECKKSIEYTC